MLQGSDRVVLVTEMCLDPRQHFFALRAGIGILRCRVHDNGFSCQIECFVLMAQTRFSPSQAANKTCVVGLLAQNSFKAETRLLVSLRCRAGIPGVSLQFG